MTDAELIAQLRSAITFKDLRLCPIAADRIKQLVAANEAQAAEIERLRSYLDRIEKASESFTNPEHSELTLSYAHESTRRLAREALTGSATVKESLTTEDEKQSHEWKCPIDYPGCRKNCGSYYGCGN